MSRKRYIPFILIVVAALMAPAETSYASHFEPTGAFSGSPAFESKSLDVPAWQYPETGDGDILVENFEYWDSPCNHGWRQHEPPYPLYGFGMGYAALFGTVLDMREGSRVLEVYRPPSIFLIGREYERHRISIGLATPPSPERHEGRGYIDLTALPILSFRFLTPLALDAWEMFQCDVLCRTEKGHRVTISMKPVQAAAYSCSQCDYFPTVVGFSGAASPDSLSVRISLGRNFTDGTWHVLWVNLPEMVKNAVEEYGGIPEERKGDWRIVRADTLIFCGHRYRLDNIIFRTQDYSLYSQRYAVDVVEIGPLYAQIFEPYRFLLFASYRADHSIRNIDNFLLDQNNFICDPNCIRDTWVADLLALDPGYHVIDANSPLYDPDYTRRWVPGDPNFGTPDPVAERYLGNGFFIDATLPLFADQRFRIGGDRNGELHTHGRLGWNSSIGGFGGSGIDALLVRPLPIDPYDGMPTYIVDRFLTMQAIDAYGKGHFGPALTHALESALWNAGMEEWPHIASFDYAPQYFEDLLVAVEVINKNKVEKLVFPVSVVNYPVENYPPEVQARIFPRVFDVGEETECIILSVDPDCFIFSLAHLQGRTPATTHLPMLPGNRIRDDQDNLYYEIFIEGLHAYRYGPWIECDADPFSGVARLTPKFEGNLRVITICRDHFGAFDQADRTIICVNPGTWYNHPPVITALPNPRIIRAGEEVVFNARAEDPDGDEVYVTCNIGSVGKVSNGDTVWTFQTNFPGTYLVEILFFDIRGGYASTTTNIQVIPWWSF
ncbi:MAG: hypothetical protein ACMUIL_09090 [bacterium]